MDNDAKNSQRYVMKFDGWIRSYRVTIFSWIDGETIYVNVQYYAPGQSIARPPVWDKTVYIYAKKLIM